MVEINGSRHRFAEGDTVVAVNRVPELRSWTHDPSARTVRLGAGRDLRRARGRPARHPAPGARSGRPHGRVPADPQRRHDRGQPGDLLARRRRSAGPFRPRRGGRAAGLDRPAGARRRRVHDRGQAHRPATGRADHRRDRARARRLAGIRQGRHPQRDGDRHRRGVPGRRPTHPLDPPRPRVGRPDHRPGRRGRGARFGDGRLGHPLRRRCRDPGVRPARRRRDPADRRPPGDRGVPAARRRGARPAAPAPGVPGRADRDGRAVPPSRQRCPPRGAGRLAGREPPVRAPGAARSARGQGRVRGGRVRLVQRARRRRARLLVPRPRRQRRRPADPHHRRAVRTGRADGRPAGLRRRRGGAVRVLHARTDHGRPRPPRPASRADGDRDPRGAVGQHLPLHGLRPDHRRRPDRGRRPPGAPDDRHRGAGARRAPRGGSATRRRAPTGS